MHLLATTTIYFLPHSLLLLKCLKHPQVRVILCFLHITQTLFLQLSLFPVSFSYIIHVSLTSHLFEFLLLVRLSNQLRKRVFFATTQEALILLLLLLLSVIGLIEPFINFFSLKYIFLQLFFLLLLILTVSNVWTHNKVNFCLITLY